jgi:hypothetical protein
VDLNSTFQSSRRSKFGLKDAEDEFDIKPLLGARDTLRLKWLLRLFTENDITDEISAARSRFAGQQIHKNKTEALAEKAAEKVKCKLRYRND